MKSVGQNATPRLSCNGVWKSFGGVQSLSNVTLQFPDSSVTAIIGPNGAGKTTLLNVLSGLVRADAGDCFIGAKQISRLAPHCIARLGVARTFQELRLVRQMSVIENVVLACPLQSGERLLTSLFRLAAGEEARNWETAMSVLGLVGLKHVAHVLAGRISYGQQKMLTLACAIASGANTVLLDEPASGIHPELLTSIANLLVSLRDEGKCLVVVEHDVSFVKRIADRVIVLTAGAVIAQGKPLEVLDRADVLEAYIGR